MPLLSLPPRLAEDLRRHKCAKHFNKSLPNPRFQPSCSRVHFAHVSPSLTRSCLAILETLLRDLGRFSSSSPRRLHGSGTVVLPQCLRKLCSGGFAQFGRVERFGGAAPGEDPATSFDEAGDLRLDDQGAVGLGGLLLVGERVLACEPSDLGIEADADCLRNAGPGLDR